MPTAEDQPTHRDDDHDAAARRERDRGDDRGLAEADRRPDRQVRAAGRGRDRQGQRRNALAGRRRAGRDPGRARTRRSPVGTELCRIEERWRRARSNHISRRRAGNGLVRTAPPDVLRFPSRPMRVGNPVCDSGRDGIAACPVVAGRAADRRGARHRHTAVEGTGIGGRVTKRDILAHIDGDDSRTGPRREPAACRGSGPAATRRARSPVRARRSTALPGRRGDPGHADAAVDRRAHGSLGADRAARNRRHGSRHDARGRLPGGAQRGVQPAGGSRADLPADSRSRRSRWRCATTRA